MEKVTIHLVNCSCKSEFIWTGTLSFISHLKRIEIINRKDAAIEMRRGCLYNSNHVCCAMLSFVTEAFYYLKDTVDHKSIFVSNNSSMSGGYRRNKYWISFLSAQNIWDALKYQLLVKLYLSAQVNLLFKNKPRYFTALTHSRVEPF